MAQSAFFVRSEPHKKRRRAKTLRLLLFLLDLYALAVALCELCFGVVHNCRYRVSVGLSGLAGEAYSCLCCLGDEFQLPCLFEKNNQPFGEVAGQRRFWRLAFLFLIAPSTYIGVLEAFLATIIQKFYILYKGKALCLSILHKLFIRGSQKAALVPYICERWC